MRDLDGTALTEWCAELQRRHMESLRFAEVRRGVQALSRRYVQTRAGLERGAPIDGAGKRAAFAMFYGPLHYALVSHVVEQLGATTPAPRCIHDLGCGTGAAGAAWANRCEPRPRMQAIDRSGWAIGETRRTWKYFGLSGRPLRGSLLSAPPARRGDAVLAAWVVNELGAAERDELLERLVETARRGGRALVIEPIARSLTPWWDDWARAFEQAGGRDDSWRVPAELPDAVRELDRAAGLDHRELTARTLYVG